MLHGALERRQEFLDRGRSRHRDVAYRTAGDDEAVRMDRIARVGHQHRVPGRGDGLREVGEALLRTERHNHFRFRIEVDVEAALVVRSLRLAKPRDTARGRVAVRARVGGGFRELGHDVRRGGQVGIAHAEIDHVLAGSARARLHGVHFREHVRRQALQAMKFGVVHFSVPIRGRGISRRAGWQRCRALCWSRTSARSRRRLRQRWRCAARRAPSAGSRSRARGGARRRSCRVRSG